MTPAITERYSRQEALVPSDRLVDCGMATVVGVGAVGRQVALQLAAMGIPWLKLVDFDRVEESNLASQGYRETDLGKRKVDATMEMCYEINSTVQVDLVHSRFKKSESISRVVFACVDSIDARKFLWNAVKDRVTFFADGRVAGEVIRVLTAYDGETRDHYPTTLFAADEAYVGSCTAKMTIYCANLAAGLMVGQFAKWLRSVPVAQDLVFNLLSEEVSVLR